MVNDELGIVRLNDRPFKGWLVRFIIKKINEAEESFPDSKFDNDKEKSKAAAIAWRNKMRKKLAKSHGISFENRRLQTSNVRNTSGVIGVSLNKRKNRESWMARVGPATNTKTFSIKKYGYSTAFKMACAYRTKHAMINPIDAIVPEPPEWLKDWAASIDFILD